MSKSNSVLSSISAAVLQRPLFFILLFAFGVRLIAVLFAQGFMMHDDHFLTIEPSSSWAAGKNFNGWLPGIGNNNPHPEPISFFYLGGLFLLFKAFHFLGLDNPESQMYLMRFIHALYSLLVVYYGFKITELLSNRKNAIQAGFLLAFIAILPNFSVRNLVELVCVPPLMAGFYLLIQHVSFKNIRLVARVISATTLDRPNTNAKAMRALIFAALLMGMAVGIRYQTGLLVALVGLILLIFHSFRYAFLFGVVSFGMFFLTQIDDVLLWGGEPFQHLKGYFQYNTTNANNYPGSSIAYLSFIAIFILPPISLFLVTGFFREWRKQLLFVLPVTGFVLFHIWYPNRQERFILPALPFVVMIGVIGWNALIDKSKFWMNNKKLLRGSWVFFWTVNTIVMLTLCFTYSKKCRVESMSYLFKQGDCRNFALEYTHIESGSMLPQFYSGIWTTYYYWKKGDNPSEYILNMHHDEEETINDLQPRLEPNYYLFYDDTNLEDRVAKIREHYPDITFLTTVESGWFDQLLNRLNPKNALETIHIYKIPSLSGRIRESNH